MSPASPALLCWPIALRLLGRSLGFGGGGGSFIGRDGLAGHPVAFWTEVVGGCVLALLVAVTGWAH